MNFSREQISKAFEATSRFSVYGEMSEHESAAAGALIETIHILRMLNNLRNKVNKDKPNKTISVITNSIRNMPEETLAKELPALMTKVFSETGVETKYQSLDGMMDYIAEQSRAHGAFDNFVEKKVQPYKETLKKAFKRIGE